MPILYIDSDGAGRSLSLRTMRLWRPLRKSSGRPDFSVESLWTTDMGGEFEQLFACSWNRQDFLYLYKLSQNHGEEE